MTAIAYAHASRSRAACLPLLFASPLLLLFVLMHAPPAIRPAVHARAHLGRALSTAPSSGTPAKGKTSSAGTAPSKPTSVSAAHDHASRHHASHRNASADEPHDHAARHQMLLKNGAHRNATADEPAAYTKAFKFEPRDRTLLYGDETLLRAKPPPLPHDAYAQAVRSLPIACVDVLLTRPDGKVLLVKRHSEPARALYWYPGGRLLMGETFAEAAARKARKEIGVDVAVCGILGVYNTLFERSAFGHVTQTVNILVHASASQPLQDELPICGDRTGKCEDGRHGLYRWVAPETESGEDEYVLQGLAQLRAAAPCAGGDGVS